jgi:8-oxo-dGTP pyrophosphatase MutT (NUDIX family)
MSDLNQRVARRFLLGGGASYGGFVVNDEGKVLLREPTNHFDGYHWTFAKGGADPNESPEEAALREVREETGVEAEIIGELPGSFRGGTSEVKMFLMRPLKDHGDYHWETQDVRWVDPQEAQELVKHNTNPIGLVRDLQILDAGWDAHAQAQSRDQSPGTRADHNKWWTQYLHEKWDDGKRQVPNPDWRPGGKESHKTIQMVWRMKKDRAFSKQIAHDFERYKEERAHRRTATIMFGPGGKSEPKPSTGLEIPSSDAPSSFVAPKREPKQGPHQLSLPVKKKKRSSFLQLLVDAAKKNPALAAALKAELQGNEELQKALHKEWSKLTTPDPNPKPRTSYGGVVFNSEGKVLMRLPDPRMEPGSTWTFAKGGRDKGEMPGEAAVREVYEETGVKAKIVGGVQGKFQGLGGDTHYYIMEPEDESQRPDSFGKETAQIGWFTPQEAQDLISAGTNDTRRKRDLAVLSQALSHRAPDSSMEADQKNWEIFLDKFYDGGKRQVPRPSDYKTPGEQTGESSSGGNQKKTLSVSTLLKNHPPFRKALRAQFKAWLANKKTPRSYPGS